MLKKKEVLSVNISRKAEIEIRSTPHKNVSPTMTPLEKERPEKASPCSKISLSVRSLKSTVHC